MIIERFPDHEAASRAAGEHLARAAELEISRKGSFTLALCGGTSPKRLFELLAAPPLVGRIPWEGVYLFWGDERLVECNHPESNFGLAKGALLDLAPIRPENVYRMPGELEPGKAAEYYQEQLAAFFGAHDDAPPSLDLVLLGLGPDGHTASLFPGAAALNEKKAWVAPVPAPGRLKPHLPRLTFTPRLINAASRVLFLVSGAGKRGIVEQVLFSKGRERELLPAQTIRPRGELAWFLDAAAAGA